MQGLGPPLQIATTQKLQELDDAALDDDDDNNDDNDDDNNNADNDDDDIEKLIPRGGRVLSLGTVPHSCGFACPTHHHDDEDDDDCDDDNDNVDDHTVE